MTGEIQPPPTEEKKEEKTADTDLDWRRRIRNRKVRKNKTKTETTEKQKPETNQPTIKEFFTTKTPNNHVLHSDSSSRAWKMGGDQNHPT